MDEARSIRIRIDAVYRAESRRVFATLVRLLGDFDLAEESLQEAFAAAVQQWPAEGVPDQPRAWLVTAARFKAIDRMRRGSRWAAIRNSLVEADGNDLIAQPIEPDEVDFEDDLLRLVFTCAHPALPLQGRVALALREVCGLTTEEIARSFLAKPATIAQRIVRAKHTITEQAIPYEVPGSEGLAERLDGVLQVIYLVFNEGYAASAGTELTRPLLIAQALRMGRLLAGLLPEAEVHGLLALMLLHDARRRSRVGPSGEMVLLEDQDRSRWDHDQIREGVRLVERALASRGFGPYSLQAAIAALHCEAEDFSRTDWPQILGLYEVLMRHDASPVVALNRAAALAMVEGPAAGLAAVEQVMAQGELDNYFPALASRAELNARLGRLAQARADWIRALELTRLEPEKRLIRTRLGATGI